MPVSSSSQQEQQNLRQICLNALKKNLYQSAAIIAEKLVTSSDGTDVSDHLLYAKCFYLNGEPRRCLAVLEQRELLSAQVISTLATAINKNFGDDHPVSNIQQISLQLEAIQLAAQCLFLIDQFEDCICLLEPLIIAEDDDLIVSDCVRKLREMFECNLSTEINEMSAVYCLFGKCCDVLDNRAKSLKCLNMAIRIDTACTEAAELMVQSGMLSFAEKRDLFSTLTQEDSFREREWLISHYQYLLLDQNPSSTTSADLKTSSSLVREAEYSFNHQQVEEAYRLARHAYTIDPFDSRGLTVYIASMVELKLKTELFYLGHELVNSYPKMALSWYCVGCYYWCCNKQEYAQKYIQKATKMDKKFSKAWVMLGHVLSMQEESEQAISAYRTAIRLLPGDHRPMVYMAKELVRTNYLSLALHILLGALDISPSDCGVLNELGVVYMKMDNIGTALEYFRKAVEALDSLTDNNSNNSQNRNQHNFSFKRSSGLEIYNNYAVALRKSGDYEEALRYLDICLSFSPLDPHIYANKAFTLHLMKQIEAAINFYHKALSIQPKFAFCSEMINRAMEDILFYNSNDENTSSNVMETETSQFAFPTSTSKQNTFQTHNNISIDNSYDSRNNSAFVMSPDISLSNSKIVGRLSLDSFQST